MTSKALDLRDLSISFGSGHYAIHAFSNVTFQADAGRFIVLIGPSGCGKSTLLRAIGDLLPTTSGSLAVYGEEAANVRLKRRISFVFQDATLLPWRTVIENVRLPLEVGQWKRVGRTNNSAEDMLALVGLKGRENAFPHQLSGGQRQRVSIARALITKPDILLMDEPFGALDEITRDRLNDEILRIWAETKTTVVFVTHSLSEAAFLGQTVAVMAPNPGRFIAEINLGDRKPRGGIDRTSEEFFNITKELRQVLLQAYGAAA